MTFLEYLKYINTYNSLTETIQIWKHKKIYDEWQEQLKSKKSTLDLELPWVTIEAKNYLQTYMSANKCKAVFEYGSGGSSLFFCKFSNLVVSAEHNAEWFEKVLSAVKSKQIKHWDGFLAEAEKSENTKTLSAENPEDYFSSDPDFSDSIFKNYSSLIGKYNDGYFDIVLIDGRSRPACIMHSYNKVKVGGLLVIDNAEREYYFAKTEHFFDNYELVLNSYSALICTGHFTKTNIYKRIK